MGVSYWQMTRKDQPGGENRSVNQSGISWKYDVSAYRIVQFLGTIAYAMLSTKGLDSFNKKLQSSGNKLFTFWHVVLETRFNCLVVCF